MTNEEAKADMKRQIEVAREKFSEHARGVHTSLYKAVEQGCMMIGATSKHLMRDTAINPDITYYRGKHHNIEHHPSMPYNAPNPDVGTLMSSVMHDVTDFGNTIIGRVGSVITNPPYGAYLENRTSKMAPRPWLLPSLDINRSAIEKLLSDGAEGRTIEVGIDVTD